MLMRNDNVREELWWKVDDLAKLAEEIRNIMDA